MSELGHSKVIIQSDGEPSSEVVMRMVHSKGAMTENPPCEIMQQQSQRYSHQCNGGAERMVQTIRSQIKAHKIQIEKKKESTVLCSLRCSVAIHAIPQTTRLNNSSIRKDSTHVLPKPHSTCRRCSCVQTTRSTGPQVGICMARRCLAWT